MNQIKIIQITPSELTNLINESISTHIDSLKEKLSNSNKEESEFITRQNTADFFKISLVCLHDWVNKGIVCPYKMGNRTYFKRSELVETLLNSNTKTA
jgi:hypothetical protein